MEKHYTWKIIDGMKKKGLVKLVPSKFKGLYHLEPTQKFIDLVNKKRLIKMRPYPSCFKVVSCGVDVECR